MLDRIIIIICLLAFFRVGYAQIADSKLLDTLGYEQASSPDIIDTSDKARASSPVKLDTLNKVEQEELPENDNDYIEEDLEILKNVLSIIKEDTTQIKEKLEYTSEIVLSLMEIQEVQNSPKFIFLAFQLIKAYNDKIVSLRKLDSDSPILEIYERLFGANEKLVLDEELLLGFQLPKFEIPIVMTKSVKKFIKHYMTIHRENFQRYLARACVLFPLFERIIEEEGLPKEIIYLSIIESGVNPKARSRADAVGAWQFMKSTGRLYGLKGNRWFDERANLEKATRSSMRMLKELYEMFGDWHLALTAYNAGPGRVRRAIRLARSKNLKKLGRYLKRESREYVPRYMAASIVGMHAEKFGFNPIVYQNIQKTSQVEMDGMVSFATIAKYSGVSKEILEYLNPELMLGGTPPAYRRYKLNVPLELKEQIQIGLDSIPDSLIIYCLPYRAKRNVYLSTVAKKLNKSVGELRKLNYLATTLIRKRQVIVYETDKKTFLEYEHNLNYISDDSREPRRKRRRWQKKFGHLRKKFQIISGLEKAREIR